MRPPAIAAAPLVTGLLLAVPLTGCGADDDPLEGLDDRAREGYAVVAEAGCQACHGVNGDGGVGPSWIGLAGSTVELDDGSTVVADDDYLRRSITDPGAELVAGYTIRMPENGLDTEEIEAVIAYIEGIS